MKSISVYFSLLIDEPGPTHDELYQRMRDEINELLARDTRREQPMFKHTMVLNINVDAGERL